MLGLVREGKTIEAIKRLRALTGCGLAEASSWVVNHPLLEPPTRQTKPCPYCGKPLRTDLARQCFECGRDWHDPARGVKRDAPRDGPRRSEP